MFFKTFSTFAIASILATTLVAEDKKELLTIVTAPDAQTQLMAMVLSTQAQKQGVSVHILLCGPGGDLALKDGKETKLKPNDASPQMLLGGLMKSGAVVEVCPLYLPNMGKGEADLKDGIKVGKPPMIAEKILKENTKVLSY